MPKGRVAKKRIDQLCVEAGLCASRQQAQALIRAGQVVADDRPVTKPGSLVAATAAVRLRGEPPRFVSRGGLKLEAMLDRSGLDVSGMVALDVGASTGGFTDCLLQRGARHVVAVDVGYGQLAWKLRQDQRVSCIERTNARAIDAASLRPSLRDPSAWPPELATIDVSFISLTLVLPATSRLLGAGRPLVALVKPQFEAGRQEVSRGAGVVRGEARARAIDKVLDWARRAGYTVAQRVDSPITGPQGNLEHLVLLETPRAQE